MTDGPTGGQVQGEGWLIEGRYGQRPGHDRNVERVKKAPRVGTPMGTDKRRLDPETAQMISESGFPERSRNDDATIQQRVEAHREKREERYGVDRNDGRDPLRQRVAGKGSEPSLKNSRPATDAVPSDDPATAGESGEEVHDGGTAPHAIPESEFARDDEFKALQKAHQRLKGRYKKLERTVTLKDQIIKTREFEISELRKGLR